MRSNKTGQFIKKYLFGNVTAKVMALAMALAVWFYAHSFSQVRPAKFDIPVKVSLTEGWSLASQAEMSVNVTMSYLRRFERDVSRAREARQIFIRCGVAPVEGGDDEQTVSVALKPSDLEAREEFGIRVLGFDTEELPIRVTREVTVSLYVRVKTSAPPPGYKLKFGEVRPEPRRVSVRGREDILKRVTEIETAELDVTSPRPMGAVVEWNNQKSVPIAQHVTVDGIEHPVKCDEKVLCRYVLEQVPKSRQFPDILINLLAPPDYPYVAELRVLKTEVTVSGPADVVEGLAAENIVLYVDVGKLQPNEVPFPQAIHANIVKTPGARGLVIKLGTETCGVKVSKKSPE